MPRGSYLTNVEQGKILAFNDQGLGLRAIGRKIGRSHKVVSNFLRNPELYGTNKKGGPKKKVSPRTERRIIATASNSLKSCRQIANECDAQVSRWKIGRILKNNRNIKRQKLTTGPRLLPRHKEARLEFGRQNMNRNWDQVIFSDEKKFNLDGPDGYQYYWRDLRKDPRYFSTRNFGGGSLMVWGAFCKDGVLRLSFPSTRMNSREYIGVLTNNLLPFLEEHEEVEYLFQQDNARIHVSRESREWFGNQEVTLLEWPACSPDMNPIENLWGIMVRRVYAENKQYDTIAALREAIEDVWTNLEPEIIINLVTSMRNRIFELVRKKRRPDPLLTLL